MVAVERTRMPMLITDPNQADNPIVLANQAFLNLTGYTAAEVIGRNCRFLQGEATSASAIEEIRAAIAGQRELNTEILNYKKNGAEFWNQLHLSPVCDDEGRLIYFFASQMDVTEKRKIEALEAAEHRMLKEIDHRAMNVLAIVEGIIRQSRADDLEQYVSAVHGRIQALASAHTMLAARRWADVPLPQLIQAQVDARSIGDRARLVGPDLRVDGSRVQSLALVFHELISNAVTHGSLRSPLGLLDVRWEENSEDQGFTLSWKERGGAPPRAEQSPGFGSKIVTAIIERQFRGQWVPVWEPEGLTARLRAPGCIHAKAA